MLRIGDKYILGGNEMKRVLSIALLLMMLLSLVACGGDTPAEDSPEDPAPTGEEGTSSASGDLVIYTGCGPEITDPILELFQEMYGHQRGDHQGRVR